MIIEIDFLTIFFCVGIHALPLVIKSPNTYQGKKRREKFNIIIQIIKKRAEDFSGSKYFLFTDPDPQSIN